MNTPQFIVRSPEEIAKIENIRLDFIIKNVLFNCFLSVSNKVQTTKDQMPRLARISKEEAFSMCFQYIGRKPQTKYALTP